MRVGKEAADAAAVGLGYGGREVSQVAAAGRLDGGVPARELGFVDMQSNLPRQQVEGD